jgi:hypothetical protein
LNVPVAVGVPLIVIVLLAKAALTPAGKPLAPETPAFDIPVAPMVVCVIFVNAVLIHSVGVLDAAPDVFMQGVTAAEATEGAELPTAFVATTVKV